jgi:hypothetical protein
MITGPVKQSPITTSLLPILITFLATLLCASSPPGIHCPTCCSTGLTGSLDWSNQCECWLILFSGPDSLGPNQSGTCNLNLSNTDP